MRVSCIVAAEGEAAGRTIRALLAQTHEDLEILVAETGPEATAATLRDLPDDPRLLQIPGRPAGTAAAWNAALARATGEAVTLTPAGWLRPPWAVAALVAALERGRAEAAIGPGLVTLPDGRLAPTRDDALLRLVLDWMPAAEGAIAHGQPLFAEHAAFVALAGPAAAAWLLSRDLVRRLRLALPDGRDHAALLLHLLVAARAARIAPVAVPCYTATPRPDGAAPDPLDAAAAVRTTLALLDGEPRMRGIRFRSAAVSACFRLLAEARAALGPARRPDLDLLARFVAAEAAARLGPLLAPDELPRCTDPAALAWFRALAAAAEAPA